MAIFDDIVNRGKEVLGITKPKSLKQPDFESFDLIEEIEISRNPIKLKMVGNMLPMVPFEWGGEQKTVETFYPGNPEPSVQHLGSREAPLTIKGRLHDKRQPDGSAIAYAVQDVLESLRKRGHLLQISLGGKWVRWGYLTQTKFSMRDLNNLEYNLTFFIVGDTKPTQNPIIAENRVVPRDLNTDLKRINAALQNNMLNYPDGYPKDILDKINDLVSGVSEKVALVTGAIDSIIAAGERGSATLNRAVGLLAATKTFVYQSARRVGNIILENEVRKATLKESLDYGGVRSAYPTINSQRITSGYRSVKSTQETQTRLHEAQILLSQMEDDLLRYIESIPMARHLVKVGETLHNISYKYYGHADNWEKIHKHNKLKSTLLESGTILEIPR